MFRWLGVAALCLAGPASAAIYNVHVEGTLITQVNPGNDPKLKVGDKLTVNARFDDAYVTEWGDFGYSVAGLYNLPSTLDSFFRVTGPSIDSFGGELDDGMQPFYTEDLAPRYREFASPAIAFQDGKVVGMVGVLWEQWSPLGDPESPVLTLGSKAGQGRRGQNGDPNEPIVSSFTAFDLTPNFRLGSQNDYPTPGFRGVWDFAGSSVTIEAVLEPSTWALMLIGFGGIGAMMRHRSKRMAAERRIARWAVPPGSSQS